ncbi:hypothetical protein Avbf_04370 [Armadillidium vulgare]|nr:hypothetical protein Avbf_04370 [Armadillidium vulgare]
MVAYMLDYKNMEKIKSWDNVSDVSSKDIHSEGKPKLILKHMSGSSSSVSKEEFLIDCSSEGKEKSRIEALGALNNKLKSVVWFAESLEAERIRKESFLAHKISDLSCHLQGINKEAAGPSEPLANSSSTVDYTSQTSNSSNKTSMLKVLSTRHRIVHNQWVIGVSVLNNSDKFLIRNPEILLHSEKSVKSLQYITRILRTYQKTKNKNNRCSMQESDVIIEDLEPPIIRPKRKAFLFAICSFPDFSYGETLSCSGIISYQTRSLRPDSENGDTFRQMPFPGVQLSAGNLKLSCADIVRDQGGAGLSFSVLSMIAASKCHVLTIKSVGSPLDQVLEAFGNESKLVKAEGLTNFFSNQLILKTYTKDDNQALILIHNIRNYIPIDAFISPEEENCESSTGESFHEKLLPLLKSVTLKIESAFTGGEQNLKETSEKRPKNVEKASSKHKYEMEEQMYSKWRKDLSKLSSSMEMLNRNYDLQ